MSDFQKSSDVGLTRNGPLNALIFSHGALPLQKPQGVLGTGKGVSGVRRGEGGRSGTYEQFVRALRPVKTEETVRHRQNNTGDPTSARQLLPSTNRRFPEITGKDNLTVFSYSGRVKSPEWRQQLRRADLRQF